MPTKSRAGMFFSRLHLALAVTAGGQRTPLPLADVTGFARARRSPARAAAMARGGPSGRWR